MTTTPPPTLAKGLARSTVANLSVHLIADLDNGAMFRMVKKHHLVEALKAKGFVVFKTSREYLQLDEQNRTQIDGLETNSIHINVRPRMGTITEAKWPGVIEAKVKNRFTDHERLFFVKYKIKSHSLLSKTLCINKYKQAVKQPACLLGCSLVVWPASWLVGRLVGCLS